MTAKGGESSAGRRRGGRPGRSDPWFVRSAGLAEALARHDQLALKLGYSLGVLDLARAEELHFVSQALGFGACLLQHRFAGFRASAMRLFCLFEMAEAYVAFGQC